MVKIYLFLELLRAASASETLDRLTKLDLSNCKFANVVALSSDKLVAQLDCTSGPDGSKAVLDQITAVEGVVQTNIIAVVRPRKR